MLSNDLVNLPHQADGFVERGDDLRVMQNVCVSERVPLSIFEPFVADLISADMKLPDLCGHAFKAAATVDGDAAILPGFVSSGKLFNATVSAGERARCR